MKIALYIRLSRDDGDDLESESISNQRSLLLNYLKNNNLTFEAEYVDDGFSGCNFNRPAFKRLINDIEKGLINCVITKDLSRLGRDYIDTGRYIERYFPDNNIRYIAINDDIDTFKETSGMDLMPFRLSMNDMYAKDISKKVRSHLLIMKKAGKFCGSKPPYGYMKDPTNKYHLVPDPKTKDIVKRIFDMYALGYSTSYIAEILTREKVPTPIQLKNKYSDNNKNNHPEIWKYTSVNNILKNEMYTGVLIQHRTQKVSYKTKKKKNLPLSQWYILPNAHEPIISKELFQGCLSKRNRNNNYCIDRTKHLYPLAGIIYCHDCGAKMLINYDKKRNRITMNCGNYKKFSKYGICSSHFINYEKLEKTIYSKIKNLIQTLNIKNDDLVNIIKSGNQNPYTEIKSKIGNIKNNLENLQLKQDSLYDDKFNKIITVQTYQNLFNKYEQEKAALKNKLLKYEEEYQKYYQDYFHEDYENLIKDFLAMKNPPIEMIRKIIKSIYVNKNHSIEINYQVKMPDAS